MSVQFKISNSLEKLAEKLSKDLVSETLPVMQKTQIITQTTGMNRWLSIRMAEMNGVFANFEYMKPNAFINKIFRFAGLEKSKFFSPENLKWPLYSLLNSIDFKNRFKQIASYYDDDELKRLQLAVKVADLFDQYSIYRPDFMQSWSEGMQSTDLKAKTRHENWQAWLWATLKNRFPAEKNNDRVTQSDQLREVIRNDRQFIDMISDLFPEVYVFGLSVITPLHIELFNLLSEHININIYIVNPSPETFWYDTKLEKQMAVISKKSGQDAAEQFFEEGNELLTNYGSILKDAYSLLFNDETINTLDDTSLVHWKNDTLLHKIQDDISRNATNERNPVSKENLMDESVQISCNYTEVRELEALHNYLLNLFDKKPELLPKDIIVLTPDIDLYTPYISAVFDNVSKTNRIPYSIADRSYSGGDNIVGVIELLMNLSKEEFTSERVVQLLDSSYIRKSYGISNVGLIRELVRSSYIRRGISGEDKNDTNYVSWDHGIRRLILGYAIKGGDAYDDLSGAIFPIDNMESETAREGLRFIGFVDDLIKSIEARSKKRSLAAWKEYLIEDILERFIFVKDENDREYKYIINSLSSLNEVTHIFEDKIGFDVFKKSLTDLLFSETRAGEFITGGLTFSAMIPMRSLPFKVVAVLGLDNNKFPRNQVELDFNLININHRPGDRNKKDNDKHLFLETLLAAGDNLYLSYNGFNLKDNAEQPPSLLIDELITYVENSFEGEKEEVRKLLVSYHPLQAYSRKYNEPGGSLYSYAEDDSKKEQGSNIVSQIAEPDLSKVSLNDLIRFFKNPFKWYYNNILKIYYTEKEILLPENEMFELNNLDKYMLKSELLQQDNDSELEMQIERYKQTGMLGLANMADIQFAEVKEELETVKTEFDKLIEGADEEKIPISVQLNDTLLSGTIQRVYDGKCITYSFSTSKEKDRSRKYNLEAWIKHLALVADGKPMDSHFVWKYNPIHISIPSNLVSQEKAKSLLVNLIHIYRLGHQHIIPFLPEVGHKFVFKSGDVEDAFSALEGAGKTHRRKDFKDNYVEREIEEGFFDEDNISYAQKLKLIEDASNAVWQPVFEYELFY